MRYILIFVIAVLSLGCSKQQECEDLELETLTFYLNRYNNDRLNENKNRFSDIRDKKGDIDPNKCYLFYIENEEKVIIPAEYDFYYYFESKTGGLLAEMKVTISDRKTLSRLLSSKKEMFYMQQLCYTYILHVRSEKKGDCKRVFTDFWFNGWHTKLK